jgi:SAM-dependent methyltransferase
VTRYPFTDSAPSAAAVRRMLKRAYPRARGASLVVHPDDDMFAFGLAAIGSEPLSAMAYFRAGASMMDVIERIATWRFGSLARVGSFLDFAAGYGRSSRFLVKYLSPDRVTVGEIQPDALAFQAREFGVATLQSTRDPAALPVSPTFDFVFVASLFTHLPRATFGPWLSKLWDLVASGGVLVFSVHDEVLDRHDVNWEDGFAFLPASEVAALDGAEYGTNFTTEAFVRAQLAEWIGADATDAVRLPRGLCFDQDLWVIARGAHTDTPLTHENGPNGAVDRLVTDGRDFLLTGWAADTGFAEPGAVSHRLARVEVSFSKGKVLDAELGLPRPEIAAYLGGPDDPVLVASGWAARGRSIRRLRPSDIVTVTAICEHNARFVLDSTRIVDLMLRTESELPVSPMQRRALTARTVLRHRGLVGLVELVPTVVRNEWRRLGQKLRTVDRGAPRSW